jgi:homoserine kinase type II
MHIAGQAFDMRQPNLRGLTWWNGTAPRLFQHLSSEQAALLSHELAHQNHITQSPAYASLPKGAVHADLFRDNVMFTQAQQSEVGHERDGADSLSAAFDFYFAGTDHLLFDLCVCLNDWAIDLGTGEWDAARAKALLAAYVAVRPLTRAERELFNSVLRAAALRFWISRLDDFFKPREASLLKPHDPTHFERILRCRSQFDAAAFIL